MIRNERWVLADSSANTAQNDRNSDQRANRLHFCTKETRVSLRQEETCEALGPAFGGEGFPSTNKLTSDP